jgi:FkbM family methyltransferase
MKHKLVNMAKMMYNLTPFQCLRGLYFKCFLSMIRGRKTIATVDGMIFELDLSELIDVCVYLQKFEPDVTAAIEKLCRPGWVVLDIGANIGAHCLRLAKKVGNGGKVYAFEPTDYAYSKLLANISLNDFGNIFPYQLALSDRNLEQQEIEIKSSWRTDGNHVVTKSRVDFRRLDDWLADHSIQAVDLIKLDVDGNEYPILNGARDLLRKFEPVILMEVGAWHFENERNNPVSLLSETGYKFWDLKTYKKYEKLSQLRMQLPEIDKEMAVSVNIAASINDLFQ